MTDPTVELEKQVREALSRIAQLDSHVGEITDARCTYDIGGGKTPLICKNYAMDGSQPPLCHIHVRKSLLNLVVAGQTAIMAHKKQPLRTSARGVGVYDPRTILITPAEYKAFITDKVNRIAAVKDIPVGGVFGRSNAIAKALVDAGYT
jgi:hypothetical protein